MSTCKRVHFRTRRQDIANGTQNDGANCPVQLAIQERLAPGYEAFVTDKIVAITSEYGETVEFKAPKNVKSFVRRFDSAKNPRKIKATRFNLRIPTQFLR